MANEEVIPTEEPTDVKTVKILLNGEEMSDAYQVESILVHKEVNRIPFAKLMIIDGAASERKFEISDSGEFDPGTLIEVQAGYNGADKTIFKGVIVRQGVRLGKRKNSVLKIEAKDEYVGLCIGRKSSYFYDSKDSDIINDILDVHKKAYKKNVARNYELKRDIKKTDLKHAEMVQYYCTDWDFIVTRAEKNGMLVALSDGNFVVDKPNLSQKSSATLTFGATIFEFESELDAISQYKSVESFSWDISELEPTDPRDSKEPDLGKQGKLTGEVLSKVLGIDKIDLHHIGNVIDEELQAWSDAKMLRSRLARLRGRVKCQGFNTVLPGNVIELKGVGDHYNGGVYVSGVRHLITDEIWEMDIQFGLKEDWFSNEEDIIDSLASGLVPGINGLHIGVVTQIEKDPDSEFRLLVRMPLLGDNKDDGVWARVALLDAGENRGTFFRPEIGDEVVLGFLNADPRDPIVLGSLHSSKKASPIEPKDDNDEKGIITRSGMKLLFNDKDNIIHVQTADDKNKIRLDNKESGIFVEDEHGNIIEMTSKGISISSASDIILKAKGDISMEAENIEGKGKSEVKFNGKTGAELSTSGVAVLKGDSSVQIN